MFFKTFDYRGYDPIAESWCNGFLLADADIKGRMYILSNFSYGLDKTIVEPDSIGMYSPWRDRNKRPICDGDIIDLKNEEGKTVRVVCRFGRAHRDIYGTVCDIVGFHFINIETGAKTFPIVVNYKGVHDTRIFRIVGNTFEHAELIPEQYRKREDINKAVQIIG